MEFRRVPHVYDAARRLYERADEKSETLLLKTIELDTVIESARAAIKSDPRVDVDEVARFIGDFAETSVDAKNVDTLSNFTDLHRLVSAAKFSQQRLFLPFMFSETELFTPENRQEMADGMEGLYTQLISGSLLYLDEQASTALSSEIERGWSDRVFGAIQEDTVGALLNFEEDGNIICVPSSATDDVYNGIDVYMYYMRDGEGYVEPISIKSSNHRAALDKKDHPDRVVVSSEDFSNKSLSVSRLLVRNDEGYPGINNSEQECLRQARKKLRTTIFAQIKERGGPCVVPTRGVVQQAG